MNPLRLLIIDDEPLARQRLRSLVGDINEQRGELRLEVVAEAGSATQALQWLREHDCDVALVDMQMPGPDGLQFADLLRQRSLPGPLLIYVTAYPGHAVGAFEREALDYLTKPVRRERLQAALQRAAQRLLERRAVAAFKQADTPEIPSEEAGFLSLTERGRLVRVPLAEVLYFKAEQKYLTVRTAREVHLMDASLSEVEQRFPERFLRIHRNALVARTAVRELERRAPSHPEPAGAGVSLDPGDGWAVRVAYLDEWLAVSRRQVAAVRDALASHPPPR